MTSINGTPTAVTMGAVMAGVIVIAAALLVLVRRSWARTALEEAESVVADAHASQDLAAAPEVLAAPPAVPKTPEVATR